MRKAMFLLLVGATLLACGDDEPVVVEDPAGTLMPDFSLLDVNPASSSFGRSVSPGDYGGAVSVWYFGSST